MLSSEEPKLVNLSVVGNTPATEISICDARFREVELPHNAGTVDVQLPVGMYKVMFREGDATVERVASLFPGSDSLIVYQEEPAAFDSAAPLEETRTSHEWHQEPVFALSSSAPTIVLGTGTSELLVFVRDLGEPVVIELEDDRRRLEGIPSDVEFRLELETNVSQRLRTYAELDDLDPTEGLSLCNLVGEPLSDVVPYDSSSRVGGLLAHLGPGTYRLRLDTGTDLVLEMPIACVGGRQSQVFLLCQEYDAQARNRRADFDSASISLAGMGSRFDPQAESRRLTEIALQALGSRRPLHGPDLTEILEEKFEDPMLGIIGAHLLFLDERPDVALLDTVIGNTRALLAPHPPPDVQALQLRRAMLDGELPEPVPCFEAPPMLVASWDAIVAATRSDPDIVPSGSLSDLISDRLMRRGPWLAWAGPPEHESLRGQFALGTTPADLIQQVAEALGDEAVQKETQESPTLTAGERMLATSIEPAVDPFYRKLKRVTGLISERHTSPTETDLSAALNLPVHSVRRLARGVLEKLVIKSRA